MRTKLIPALAYCNLTVGEQHVNYDDPTKWIKKDFDKFFYAFHLNKVDNFNVQNPIGKLSSNQVSPTGVTTLLNAEPLANFMCVSCSIRKILVFKQD